MNNKTNTLKIEMMEASIIKKNDPTRCNENEERIKNDKNPSQSKWPEEEVENPFFCLRFCSIDLF
ncbi:hypothetical protein ACLGA2_01880 [Helicobacter pylori]